MITRQEFLDVIFGEIEDDEFVCVSRALPKKDGSGMWFDNHLETDRAWRKWNPDKKASAWYYNISSVDGAMNAKGTMVSRGRANLKYYYVLVLDDLGDKTDFPAVEPTYKLESSVASFQWGYALVKGSDFERFEALVQAIHEKGFGDAGAGGSYRLVRIPGSANLKPGKQEFRSRITEWNPDRYWTLDGLAAAFGIDLDALPVKDLASVSNRSGGAQALQGIDPMLDWLADAGHVVSDNGGEWVDIVCPWADQHTSGANTGCYSPLGRGRGDWVQTRSWSCLHEHCLNKKISEFVGWAEKLGAPSVKGYDPSPWAAAEMAPLLKTLNMRTKNV